MPSPIPNDIKISSADSAARAATMGAFIGMLKWGAVSAAGATAAYFFSPLFRSLTIQFRVYLWMCPTSIGSMVEADYRLRCFEAMVRAERRNQVEAAHEKALLEEMVELEAMERRQREKAESR